MPVDLVTPSVILGILLAIAVISYFLVSIKSGSYMGPSSLLSLVSLILAVILLPGLAFVGALQIVLLDLIPGTAVAVFWVPAILIIILIVISLVLWNRIDLKVSKTVLMANTVLTQYSMVKNDVEAIERSVVIINARLDSIVHHTKDLREEHEKIGLLYD